VALRVSVTAVVLVLAVGSACTSKPSGYAHPEEVVADLPNGLTTAPPDDGLGLLQMAVEPAEESVIRYVLPAGDEPHGCTSVAVAAFTPIPDVVDDFESLVSVAASGFGKDVEDFEPVVGLNARLAPGLQEDCAESVLALELGDLFVIAAGSPDTVELLIDHFR
jgi:hypothetical protein